MRRRSVLDLAALAGGAALIGPLAGAPGIPPATGVPPDGWRELAARLSGGGSSVGLSDVRAVEAAARDLLHADLARGARLTTGAEWMLYRAAGLLDRRMSDPLRIRLAGAVALLADRIGWASYDAGDPHRAVRLLRYARDTAALGADRDLLAHIALDLSTVVTDSGDPVTGVEILGAALADERVGAAERANLHAVCARHCAGAGRREAGLRHIALAEHELRRSGAESGSSAGPAGGSRAGGADGAGPAGGAGSADPADGVGWARRITVAPGHHDSALGLALFALGERTRARERLAAALLSLDAGRTRTAVRCRTRLAVLHLRDGDGTGAAPLARQAAAGAAGVRSARIAADLRMMLAALRQRGMAELAAELGSGPRPA